jgi:hypothetical protein
MLVHKPSEISWEEAAGIPEARPITFLPLENSPINIWLLDMDYCDTSIELDWGI